MVDLEVVVDVVVGVVASVRGTRPAAVVDVVVEIEAGVRGCRPAAVDELCEVVVLVVVLVLEEVLTIVGATING